MHAKRFNKVMNHFSKVLLTVKHFNVITNMKKKFILVTICLTIVFDSFGQKISKKEAQQIFEKTLGYLKTNDTTSFVNLWHFDDTPRPYNKKVYTRRDAVEEFVELKSFLDIAITKNLPFDEIDIEKMDSFKEYNDKYKIKGWFKYDEKKKYYKDYGFLIYTVNGKWGFRFTTETSIS